MTQGKARDARKEQQWRQWIEAWQRSGLTVRVFCGQRGLSEANFYAWRRELAKRDATLPTFMPVHILTDGADLDAALEIILDSRRRVRVPAGFDAATLRRLLAVLEEPPPC